MIQKIKNFTIIVKCIGAILGVATGATTLYLIFKDTDIKEKIIYVDANTVSQPVSQPATQPVSQPTTQPVSQPAAQPISQPAAQPVPQQSAAVANVIVRNTEPDLKIEFKRCIARNGVAYIDFSITNTSRKDTKMEFYHSGVTIYDNEGSIYRDAYVGTTNTSVRVGIIDIPSEIPYGLRVVVREGFDPSTTEIKLLKVGYNWDVFGTKSHGWWETNSFEMRNIPISKE
jgi:hypothetical protein